MKAVISSDYTNIYLFNIPIVAWAWKKLGVDVIWFQKSPSEGTFKTYQDGTNALLKLDLISYTTKMKGVYVDRHFFDCPIEKAATYAQVSRLFAACLNLPEEELLITSDADMLLMRMPYVTPNGLMAIFGSDLTPKGQYAMCYASGSVKEWRQMLGYEKQTYQEMLDVHLGSLKAEHFRGNFWSRDQELLHNYLSKYHFVEVPRARPGTQWATQRLDRDDQFVLDRLAPDIVDYHMHRPLWEEANFQKLMTIMKYFWPDEDFTWIETYRQEYIKLL